MIQCTCVINEVKVHKMNNDNDRNDSSSGSNASFLALYFSRTPNLAHSMGESFVNFDPINFTSHILTFEPTKWAQIVKSPTAVVELSKLFPGIVLGFAESLQH